MTNAQDKAITTGAPVATNDAQAAELTKPARRFAVKVKHHDIDAWLVDIGGKRIEYDNRADAELDRETEQAGNPGYSYTVVDITPTPRPTPGGELALTNNGIEWTWAYSSLYSKYVITNGARFIDVCFEPQAKALCARLNAADAMEQALTRIALVSNDRVVQDIASAALRGGA